ncbi:unnamed protein product, partial [Sphenostylis stenocarpa]
MALNNCSIWGCAKASQSGFATFQPGSCGQIVNFKHDLEKCSKWKCCSSVWGPRPLTPVRDENPVVNGVESSFVYDDKVQVQITELDDRFQRDVNLLPKPLTANDFSSSSDDGTKLRVAYKGLPGAYTEDAALKAYPKCETVPCDDFETSFEAVESGLVDKAVLPIESSVAGSIHGNYDLLIQHKLHIIGEVQLLINHCLLGLTGVTKEELKYVLSHPQALVQCEMMLRHLGVSNIGVDDTAAAAKAVALDGRREIGAIASSRAAKLYGLHILAEGIQDEDVNITRFLMLARDPILPGTNGPYKTSIVFSLQEGPDVLLKALGVFALRNINLSKIESRPLNQCPLRLVDDSNYGSAKYFDNLFYIDFEASMGNPSAQHALESLKILMALKDCCIWGCVKAPQLGFATFQAASSRLSVTLEQGPQKCCKWECCCLRVSAPKALTPIEDEKPVVTGVESSGDADRIKVQPSVLEGFHRDVNLLPKQLSANDFSSRDGSNMRVAYKGFPGAYSEDAALKAYPKCMTVPCVDFETTFKSVESWLVDKAVLPIESSVGGSIHRNYDLFLHHQLHIVGEVHLLINHCLLGLKGVTTEELKCVMSHPQTLVQCEMMLSHLGVSNIGVDDTAAAAK